MLRLLAALQRGRRSAVSVARSVLATAVASHIGPALNGGLRFGERAAFSWSASSPNLTSPARLPGSSVPFCTVATDFVYHDPVLKGRCQCGACGWEATGRSSFNFVCHCSVCRKATGRDFTTSAAFVPEQVRWINEAEIRVEKPPGSRNARAYCKKCQSYLGEDAQQVLGVIALPLTAADPTHAIADCYQPNHHIFYANRVEDAVDNLPKWETLPQGNILEQSDYNAELKQSARHDQWSVQSGRYRKDVVPPSPTRPPYPFVYHFTEQDPIPNHRTVVTPEKLQERVDRKYLPSPGLFVAPTKTKRDVIIIGGGHNGLISAAYLAGKGLDVLVLERRHVVGGAAITEEIVPGFKFSRASYLAGLLRPQIIKDLDLEKHGFKYITRDPSSFTPSCPNSHLKGKYLMMGADAQKTWDSIAQFSVRDADAMVEYEQFLGKVRSILNPLLDAPPPNPFQGRSKERVQTIFQIRELIRYGSKHREVLVPFYELFTGSAAQILDRWFDSEILKTTLATDAVIGASAAPSHAGSAYVLLHHVMGSAAGRDGVWAYVEGGIGAVSRCIATEAKARGAEIITDATVSSILTGSPRPGSNNKGSVTGVRMKDGTVIEAKTVLANCTPYHLFMELLPGLTSDSGAAGVTSVVPAEFNHHIRFQDYSCGAFKINCAVDRLPEYSCIANPEGGKPGPQHFGTAHFETRMQDIENAAREASMGMPATRPVIEMTIPSSLDPTVAPPGKHVVQLFVQYAPYDLDPKFGNWADPGFKEAFADRVFGIVDELAPGFSSSVIGRDVLSPLDLERIFGLHKGNIMHGALSLQQLAYNRPAPGFSSHRMPLDGLYLCGAGAHPGGGVMGAAGRNCAHIVMSDLRL